MLAILFVEELEALEARGTKLLIALVVEVLPTTIWPVLEKLVGQPGSTISPTFGLNTELEIFPKIVQFEPFTNVAGPVYVLFINGIESPAGPFVVPFNPPPFGVPRPMELVELLLELELFIEEIDELFRLLEDKLELRLEELIELEIEELLIVALELTKLEIELLELLDIGMDEAELELKTLDDKIELVDEILLMELKLLEDKILELKLELDELLLEEPL